VVRLLSTSLGSHGTQVRIAARDGVTVGRYTLNVFRLTRAAESHLARLDVEVAASREASLQAIDASFSRETFEYSVEVCASSPSAARVVRGQLLWQVPHECVQISPRSRESRLRRHPLRTAPYRHRTTLAFDTGHAEVFAQMYPEQGAQVAPVSPPQSTVRSGRKLDHCLTHALTSD
jgi:hypothetical protein